MTRLLLTLQYDGTRYHGWQVQRNARTVQELSLIHISEPTRH